MSRHRHRAAAVRSNLAALLALLLLVTTRATAQERVYAHVVRAGESLASIAQAYYGDARRELVLADENGLPDDEPLLPGTRLVIPSVRYHRVERGDTWRSLAERYYADASRAPVLIKANQGRASGTPDEGSQLLVPYPLRHYAHSSETLASIAARYYRGRDELRLLRAFNGGHSKVSRGQTILIPLFDLTLSRSGTERVEATQAMPASDDEQTRRAQAEITRDIPLLREHVHAGRFVEATALGNQLLGRPQLTGNQEISIQRELATAYVALSRDDLAIQAFARALEKQPDLERDSVRTSPRVMAALEAAKNQRTK
jgi:hypothetical protein